MARLFTCLGLALLIAAPCRACSVPVFRFALEDWKASPFVVTIYHKGPLTDAQATHSLPLEEAEANLIVKLSEDDVGKPLPWVVIRRPDVSDKTPPLWSGPLEKLDTKALCHSPAREEVARQITGGTSAVWVLLESGDEKADAAAEHLLRAELAKLEKEIELPPPERTAPDLRSPLPLNLSFAVLKVRRDAPAEAFLVCQLLALDEELATAKGPIIFPVFGRGRALCALYGDGISKKEINRSAQFLCQECSCKVKAATPGADLLISADWATAIKLAAKPDEPVKPSIKAPPIPPGLKEAAPEPEVAASGVRLIPWIVGGVVVLALVAAVFALRGGGRNEEGPS